MRKRYFGVSSRPKHEHRATQATDPQKKADPTKKRKYIKFSLLALLVIFLGIIAYVGISSFSAANNILASDIKLTDLIKGGSLKQTDGITNILLLGKGGENHPGGQLTDTIQLIRLRQSDDAVAMVSIPRDLRVSIPGDGQSKINEAYTTGFNAEKNKDKKSDAGAKLSSQVVQNITGVPIHYYLTVDFVGFKDLVDKLGGVTVNVDQDLNDPYYPKDYFNGDTYRKTDAYAPFSIKKGVQSLNGETALKYARSRETTSDFDRAKRQQKLILAIKEKMLSLGILANPVKVSDIISSLGSHVKTSMNISEIKDLMSLSEKIDKANIINKSIDNNPKDGLLVSTSEGGYYLVPKTGNFNEIQRFFKNIFEISSAADENFTVEVYNGTDRTGIANKFAEDLKSSGLNVTKIETNKEQIGTTTIYTASKGSKTLEIISGKLPNAKIATYETKGVIKIILGNDYGN
ncbi:MAG: LCP family protein [Candidatus Berkelbacteria bacterium]|nr:LCP family protein [Candidatus Berkelbacteria bacterium]